jgi:hypothetical protein
MPEWTITPARAMINVYERFVRPEATILDVHTLRTTLQSIKESLNGMPDQLWFPA